MRWMTPKAREILAIEKSWHFWFAWFPVQVDGDIQTVNFT